MARKNWIPKNLKKGALRKQLGIKKGEKIPVSALNKILSAKTGEKVNVNGKTVTVTSLLKKRANLAKTFKKMANKRERKIKDK